MNVPAKCDPQLVRLATDAINRAFAPVEVAPWPINPANEPYRIDWSGAPENIYGWVRTGGVAHWLIRHSSDLVHGGIVQKWGTAHDLVPWDPERQVNCTVGCQPPEEYLEQLRQDGVIQ